jgi:hypothetical protein
MTNAEPNEQPIHAELFGKPEMSGEESVPGLAWALTPDGNYGLLFYPAMMALARRAAEQMELPDAKAAIEKVLEYAIDFVIDSPVKREMKKPLTLPRFWETFAPASEYTAECVLVFEPSALEGIALLCHCEAVANVQEALAGILLQVLMKADSPNGGTA